MNFDRMLERLRAVTRGSADATTRKLLRAVLSGGEDDAAPKAIEADDETGTSALRSACVGLEIMIVAPPPDVYRYGDRDALLARLHALPRTWCDATIAALVQLGADIDHAFRGPRT